MLKIILIGAALGLPLAGFANDSASPKDASINSGFLEDYSLLKLGPAGNRYYKSSDFDRRIKTYDAVMIDMPEIVISPHSEYRGLKIRQLDVMTSAFREAIQKAMSADFRVVDRPGQGVMLIRVAAVDMMLKKERFHVLDYTPVGLVLTTGKYVFEPQLNRALRHIDLRGVKIEGELRDAQSGELLGQWIGVPKGTEQPETWHHLVRTLGDWAKQFSHNIQALKDAESASEKR